MTLNGISSIYYTVKEKEKKMDLCETLYEERFSGNMPLKTAKTLLLFLIFCVTAANTHYDSVLAGKSTAADMLPDVTEEEEAEEAVRTGTIISEMSEPLIPAAGETLPEPAVSGAENDTAAAESTAITDISGISADMPPVPSMSEISAGETEDSTAEVTERPAAAEEQTAATPENTDAITSEESADPVLSADMEAETVPGTVDGFLVTDSGIIYGIADPDQVVSDGYMELPDAGCTGIAAGTFSSGLPEVREIYIPAGITYIEEGAFTGLTNVEWFEMESSDIYYTEEGVLFSENGTCLLAFPSGRSGDYKVPSQVVRFAAGAFDNACLDVLDVTECSLADFSGIPENISLVVRELP